MDLTTFNQYWLAITAIEGEQMLREFNTSVYPHLKPNKAHELFRKIERKVQSVIDKSGGKLADFNETMSKIQGFMNGKR